MHETESELGSVFPNRARRQSEPGDEEEENIVIVRDEDNERDTVTKSSGDDWFSEPAKHVWHENVEHTWTSNGSYQI